MFAAQGTVHAAHSLETMRIAVVLSAAALILFWRTAIKLMLIALAAVVITLLGAGVFAFFENVHR